MPHQPSDNARVLTPRYDWAGEDPATIGLDFDPTVVDDTAAAEHINDLLVAITTCRTGQSYLAWTLYRALAAVHDQLTPGSGDDDARLVSEYAQVVARYAATGATGQRGGMLALNAALAMVHRLPLVGERLRTGIIEPWQFTTIVTRSDLIDGRGYREAVDNEIAARLGHGTWSTKRLNALVDSVIYKHDPDAIRERHDFAKKGRSVSVDPLMDGMAELRVTGTVQDVKVAFAALKALVERVCCPNDPRAVGARRSDAVIARLNGAAFECECGDPDSCTGQADTADSVSERQVVIAFHVITEQATLTAEPGSPDDGVGYIDGYGVITGDQVRDIANRSDAVRKPFPPTPKESAPQPESTTEPEPEAEPELDLNLPPEAEPEPKAQSEPEPEAPTHTNVPPCYRKPVLPSPCLKSDPYRFSTVFDTYIRARDLACSFPGCDQPAWTVELDHCWEYDHTNPANGGRTEPRNVHPLCKLHHLVKTGEHGWLDRMNLDPDGRLRYWIRTPEGIWIEGPALSGIDLFPTLKNIRFADPPAPTAPPPERAKPHRAATSDKHRRRQRERERNRKAREEAARAAIHRQILYYSTYLWQTHHPRPSPTTPDPDGDPPF